MHANKLLLWKYVTTDMWTCARQNRNGMCAQLSLIRLRWSYEETLCPCLSIKRIAKTLITLGGWPLCGFVRFFNDCWTRTRPYSPWLKDEHVQLSEMGFRRFGARRESCVVQKAPIHVGYTGPVFAPYWSARLAVGCSKARKASSRAHTASEVAPTETRGVHARVHVILGHKSQEHTENQENACDNCIAGGWFRTDFPRTQTPMAPQVLQAGHTRGSHAYELSIRYLNPSHMKPSDSLRAQ